MNAAIAGALLLFGLLFTAAAGAGFGLGRRMEQRAGARQLQSAQTLYTALRATAVRSDLEGTLGTLLTHACEGLLAVAGSVHLSKGASDSTLRLVGSIGVSEQAALTTVSAADPLWLALPAVPDGVLVLGLDDQRPPWGVFQAAGAHALVAVAVGAPGPERHGLLVLAFPSLDLAHEVRATVGSLGRHAGALLREFKAIDRRAADFKELARALRRREILAGSVAHDIDNRLALIKQQLGEAQWEKAGEGAPAEVLSEVLAGIDLVATLTGALDGSQFRIDREGLEIAELLELLPSLLRVQLQAREVAFEIDAPADLPAIYGDRIALTRVLDNLLSNAVKYGPPGGSLRLQVRQRGSDVQFDVEDSNPPIPAEKLDGLFKFGVRANAAGTVRGRGVGLWSCKQIVVAHGGRVWVEPGASGNRFSFSVPTLAVVEAHALEHAADSA